MADVTRTVGELNLSQVGRIEITLRFGHNTLRGILRGLEPDDLDWDTDVVKTAIVKVDRHSLEGVPLNAQVLLHRWVQPTSSED